MATLYSSAGLGALAVVIALGGCGKIEPNGPDDAGKLRAEARRQQASCASSVAYSRLKGQVFDQALANYRGDRANLDTLADYSTVRMENPVVEGRDLALDLTRCTGRLILEIPPGAEAGFAGERRLQADVTYTAQAAADGGGLVYRLDGAQPIVTRLAAFNLTSGAFRPPPAIDAPGAAEPVVVAQADTPEIARRTVSNEPGPVETRREDVPDPPAPPAAPPTDEAPRRADAARPERAMPPVSSRGSGEATVRAFYGALGAGDGASASAQVVPAKRSSGAYSPGAISRFYGRLPEPIRLTEVVPIADGAYRVRYRYSAGRSRCNGSAIVRMDSRNGRELIRSIRALDGC